MSTAGHDSSRVQSAGDDDVILQYLKLISFLQIFVDSPSNQEPSAGASGQDAVKYKERRRNKRGIDNVIHEY